MPPSVRLAVVAVGLVVASTLVALALVVREGSLPWTQVGQLALYAVLFALLLAGLVRRKRIAWLWARYLGFFLFAVAFAGVVANAHRMQGVAVAAIVLGFAGPLLAASLALGRPGAHAWFRLVCPQCGTPSSRGDVLLRRMRCGRCGERF